MRSRRNIGVRRRVLAELDRFEDSGFAVLVDQNGREMSVPADSLPPDSKEGDWLKVDMSGAALAGAAVDDEETEVRRQRIEEKMARLREQSGS